MYIFKTMVYGGINNMNIDIKKVKIIVTVPVENVEQVRNAICNEGAGIIGNYTYCTMSTKCIGTFIPDDKANLYIGEKNKLEFVEEKKLREVHPYEEPGIDIIPLIKEEDL